MYQIRQAIYSQINDPIVQSGVLVHTSLRSIFLKKGDKNNVSKPCAKTPTQEQ